jgi:hypothetical protein
MSSSEGPAPPAPFLRSRQFFSALAAAAAVITAQATPNGPMRTPPPDPPGVPPGPPPGAQSLSKKGSSNGSWCRGRARGRPSGIASTDEHGTNSRKIGVSTNTSLFGSLEQASTISSLSAAMRAASDFGFPGRTVVSHSSEAHPARHGRTKLSAMCGASLCMRLLLLRFGLGLRKLLHPCAWRQ